MTLIVGINFIEGPILVADSRATSLRDNKVSDTATKIFPLSENVIVGVVGNPLQGAKLLKEIIDLQKKNARFNILDFSLLKHAIKDICQDVPLDPVHPWCDLIFASVDPNNRQIVPSDKIKEYFEKYNKQFEVGGKYPDARLTLLVVTGQIKGDIQLNFPRSELFSYSFPENEVREVPILNFESWGSGSKVFKDKLADEIPKMYSVDPMPKPLLLATLIKDVIDQDTGKSHIGGLPQIVSITKEGIQFNGFQKNKNETEIDCIMRFENGVWHQIDGKTGKVVKTRKLLTDKPNLTPEEIVDFML